MKTQSITINMLEDDAEMHFNQSQNQIELVWHLVFDPCIFYYIVNVIGLSLHDYEPHRLASVYLRASLIQTPKSGFLGF